MTNNQTIGEILIRAMLNEQDGYDFYQAATEYVSNEKGKAMFRGLAHDEQEHLHILQVEYARVTQGAPFVDLDSARKELPPQPDLKLFPEKSALPAMLSTLTSDEAALKTGLEFELKGYHMYDSAAKQATDYNARAVFAYLAAQENKHYELIQKTLHYLQDKGMWFFDDIEKPIFEG